MSELEEIRTAERRARSLTDADVEEIVSAMRRNCPNGISVEDAVELKGLAAWLRKLRNAIGNVVIYGAIILLAILFYLGTGKLRD